MAGHAADASADRRGRVSPSRAPSCRIPSAARRGPPSSPGSTRTTIDVLCLYTWCGGGYVKLQTARVPAGLARTGRLRHRPHRQVPQRLRPPACHGDPARLDRVVRPRGSDHLPHVGLQASTRTATRAPTGGRRRGPALLPDRRPRAQSLSPSSSDVHRPRSVLPVVRLLGAAPRVGPRAAAAPATRAARAPAPRRVPQRAASGAPQLQRAGRLATSPGSSGRWQPPLSPAEIADRARCASRRESLLAVDEAVAAIVRELGAHGRARRHLRHLHLGQRLHAGRAPGPDRQDAALRRVDPGAADHQGPGLPRANTSARSRQRRPRADDPRRDAGATAGATRRPLSPAIRAGRQASAAPARCFTTTGGKGAAGRTRRRRKLGQQPKVPAWRAVRTTRWLFVDYEGGQRDCTTLGATRPRSTR